MRRVLADSNVILWESLISSISYDVVQLTTAGAVMRDVKDQPILDAAIAGSVEIIVTGDKDFHALDISEPLILTPRQYLDLADEVA